MAANPSIQLGTDGNWAIKEDNLLAYKKDGTRFFNKQFDFTRGSLATFVDKDGLIKVSGVTDTELVTNGDFDTDSDWTKGTGWSISNGKAVGSNSSSSLYQATGSNYTSGKTYKIVFTVSDYVSGSVRPEITNVAGDFVTSNGTFTQYIVATSSSIGEELKGASFTGSIDNVSVVEIQTDVPRIDYLGGTGHILLEPQSTNYSKNSEQPSTWHSSNGVTITADATTSPDGTTNASLVVINTSSGSRYARNLNQFPSGSGTQTVTLSCFLKYYNNQWVRLKSAFFNGSAANNESSFFDIQNGVLGTVSTNHTAKIEDYGSGWYRCSITFDIDKDTDNTGYFTVEFSPSDDASGFAEIGQGAYAFGSQGEELSFMTSYIPTSGSAVTRNAEVCNNSGSAQDFNSEEGVLYCEIAALADDNTYKRISISDGNTSNRVVIGTNNSSNSLRCFVGSAGSLQFDNIVSISDITSSNKIALKYKANDFALWINGVEVASQTGSGSAPIGLNTLRFEGAGATFDFYGKAREVKVFTEALTDEQLQKLTTI